MFDGNFYLLVVSWSFFSFLLLVVFGVLWIDLLLVLSFSLRHLFFFSQLH